MARAVTKCRVSSIGQSLPAFMNGLDIHAVPAIVVEEFRDRVFLRIQGPDIDVGANPEISDETMQHQVFAVLGVSSHRCGILLLMGILARISSRRA